MSTIIYFSQHKKNPRVYHYTTVNFHLAKIFASGVLRPSAAGCEPHELPLLWFSKHPHWEPTATKGDLGVSPKVAFAQHMEWAGCARFSLPADDPRLMEWPDACKYAGIRRDVRRALEVSGRRMGAKPSDWLAIAGAVPLADVRLQRLDGGKWLGMAASEIPPRHLKDYPVRLSFKGTTLWQFIIMANTYDEALSGARREASELALQLDNTVNIEIGNPV